MVINMENNLGFYQKLYEITEMGYISLNELLNILSVKENKITPLIIDSVNEYHNILEEIKSLSSSKGNNSFLSKTTSKLGIHLEMTRDNSDTNVASMLIEGYNKGISSTNIALKHYAKYLTKQDQKLAEHLIKFQKNNIKLLQKYL